VEVANGTHETIASSFSPNWGLSGDLVRELIPHSSLNIKSRHPSQTPQPTICCYWSPPNMCSRRE